MKSIKKAFSLVELLVALGVFTIVISSGAGFITSSYKLTTMSEQNTKARQLVNEGLEVTKYLKRKSWDSLVNGQWGINYNNQSLDWEYIPNLDITDSKYSRVVTISDIYREEDGTIVTNSPTSALDLFSKKVSVTVTWDNANNNDRTITQSFLITNWEREVPGGGSGMLVYADYSGSDDIIRYRFLYEDGTWSAQYTIPDAGVPANRDTRRIELYASDTRDEYVLMSKHTEDGQFIFAHVWDGSRWIEPIQLVGYGDNTNPNTRNFSGTYLEDGRFLAVFDDFTFTPKYRIWNGTSWGSEGSIGNLGFLSYPVWMEVEARPGSNRAIFVVRDWLQKTTTYVWDGSSWGSRVTHGSSSTGSSIENISLQWNRFSGSRLALMFNEANDNNPNIKIWNDSTNSWSSNVENVALPGYARIFEISDNPQRDQFVGCAKDSVRGISCLTTTYTPSWTNATQIATRTHGNAERSFSVGYENSGDDALVVYSNGQTDADLREPKFRTFNASSLSWSGEQKIDELGPTSSYALTTTRVLPSHNSNDVMVVMGDQSKRIHTIVWDGDNNQFYDSVGLQLTKQGDFGSYNEDFWYAFSWREYEE